MKLQILSDLHIDSYAKRHLPIGRIPKTDADLILVAGDTANSDSGMSWLQEQANTNNKPIVTIPGNHEYFCEDILTFDSKLLAWDNYNAVNQQGLKVLQCNHLDIDNVRILGCTLWTDFKFQVTEDTLEAVQSFMRDYKEIYAGKGMFSPDISKQIHTKHRAWLKDALITAYEQRKKVVVMSHHSVSAKSVSEQYANLPSNAAFVTDLSSWMDEVWAPSLWVHGHTHESFDYTIGKTRVIVNPRAYPGEISSTSLKFDWSKVIDF